MIDIKQLLIYTWNHLNLDKQMIQNKWNDSFQIEILETIWLCAKKKKRDYLWLAKEYLQQNVFTNHSYLIYMFKQDFGLVRSIHCISEEDKHSLNEGPKYNSKQLDVAVSVMLKLWGIRSTP